VAILRNFRFLPQGTSALLGNKYKKGFALQRPKLRRNITSMGQSGKKVKW
jgi:hypothetical protein